MPYVSEVILTPEQAAKLESIPPPLRAQYTRTADLTLTTTLQRVDGWLAGVIVPPTAISESAGVFTVAERVGVKASLERSYANGDQSPGTRVNITIEIRQNGSPIFNNTSSIPFATAAGGDGLLSITDPFLLEFAPSDTFEVYVSAEDGGADPADARLTRANLVFTDAFAV